MLSDEEKKVIEKLKNGKKYTLVEIIRVFKKEGIENFRITRKEYLDIILNLLEKQDNRIKAKIEELKDEYNIKLLSNAGIYQLGFNDGIKSVEDKIKSKIEELDIEIQCCEYADDDLEEYKQDIEKEKARLLRDKAILQSLLKKE